jgi:hypothetical protein
MKISNEKPPIYDRLVEAFGIDWNDGIVITYGDTLHTKEGNNIPRDLVVHERTHTRQQKAFGIEDWWKYYIANPDFRMKQEAEAYRNQWQFISQNTKDRNEAFRRKMKIVQDFSSPIYGNIITHNEALKLISK